MNVEQIPFDKVCADRQPQVLNLLDLRKKTGCSVIGYKSPEGEYILNPEPELIMQRGSKLILIGRPNHIESLKQLYKV